MANLIDAAEARAWIGLDSDEKRVELLLENLVAAASSAVIQFMSWTPYQKDYVETVSGFGGKTQPLNNHPIVAVSSVAIGYGATQQVLAPTAYIFDDDAIYRVDTGIFPRGPMNIRVAYTAGLETVPEEIVMATKYTAKAMWDAKDIDMNSAGEFWQGVGQAQFWPEGPGAIPPAARTLLRPYIERMKV